MVTISVRDETTSGISLPDEFLFETPPTSTLRDLIRLRVREEVARNNGRFVTGVSRLSGNLQAPLNWESEADSAIQGFLAGRYFVFVDDKQHEELDSPVHLTIDTVIRFIQFIPLVGG
jgi:hypothetical protein